VLNAVALSLDAEAEWFVGIAAGFSDDAVLPQKMLTTVTIGREILYRSHQNLELDRVLIRPIL
jgi:hypothetical protein